MENNLFGTHIFVKGHILTYTEKQTSWEGLFSKCVDCSFVVSKNVRLYARYAVIGLKIINAIENDNKVHKSIFLLST